MTTTETYNGWSNYETWAVALHFDNNEATYELAREMARSFKAGADLHRLVESGIWTADEAARYELADWLKDLAHTLCGIGTESEDFGIAEPSLLASDMLGAALSGVDWDEIARHVLDELAE